MICIIDFSNYTFSRYQHSFFRNKKYYRIILQASSTNIKLGDTITLSWSVLNARPLKLLVLKAPESISVLKGSVEVGRCSFTYVLIATTKDGTIATKSITVC